MYNRIGEYKIYTIRKVVGWKEGNMDDHFQIVECGF